MENNLGMLLARMEDTLGRAYAYLCCFSEHFQMQHNRSNFFFPDITRPDPQN